MATTDNSDLSYTEQLFTARAWAKALLIMAFVAVWSLPALTVLSYPSAYGFGYLVGYTAGLYVVYRLVKYAGRRVGNSIGVW